MIVNIPKKKLKPHFLKKDGNKSRILEEELMYEEGQDKSFT